MQWDGTEWTITSQGDYPALWDVWGAAPDDCFAVGNGGTILRWDGTDWSRMQSGVNRDLVGIWGTSGDDVYAVGWREDFLYRNGVILHWDGSEWTVVYEMQSPGFTDVWGTGPSDVYCLGSSAIGSMLLGSFLLHWDGNVWTELAEFSSMLEGIAGFADDDVYLLPSPDSNDSTVLHWDGLGWTNVSPQFNGFTFDLWGPTPNDLVFVGTAYTGYNSRMILRSDAEPSPGAAGVRLSLSTHRVNPGELFQVTGYLDNPGPARETVATYVVLEAAGAMYFWPSWSRYSPPSSTEVDFRYFDVPTGSTGFPVLPQMIWPDLGEQTMEDLIFYGAMLTPAGDAIWGNMAVESWGFGD